MNCDLCECGDCFHQSSTSYLTNAKTPHSPHTDPRLPASCGAPHLSSRRSGGARRRAARTRTSRRPSRTTRCRWRVRVAPRSSVQSSRTSTGTSSRTRYLRVLSFEVNAMAMLIFCVAIPLHGFGLRGIKDLIGGPDPTRVHRSGRIFRGHSPCSGQQNATFTVRIACTKLRLHCFI